MFSRVLCSVSVLLLSSVPLQPASAVDDKPVGIPDSKGGLQAMDRTAKPDIASAPAEAEAVLKQMKLPEGMKADLWAAEPELANPVALSVDERGRIFVAETHRLGSSVLDIRNYMFFLEDDLACRTVEDRLAMCRKFFGDRFADLTVEEDFIRLLEDRNHDGKVDFDSIYAGGFNHAEDGIAAGVYARHDKVWATIIPDLWQFSGTDDKGVAQQRKSLSHGYGIRFGYTGHDMHGITMGPDGRLYFSIGDRAANVMTKDGRHVYMPDCGGVFRCNQDGTGLEIVHWGLRNPQELAFDDHGNLFTGDNDFDYGDTERLVYVVEGGDSGWRVGYQHPPLGKELVPWKAEQIWVSFGNSQDKYNGVANPNPNTDLGVRPAAYLPPVTNIGDGPSGFLFDPGTGISPKFRGHFFLCHSKGSYARSEIHAFTVNEKGSTFELDQSVPFVGFVHSSDLDIGPDGAIYFLDWSETMRKTARGRVFKLYDPAVTADPLTLETKRLLEEGMATRSTSELNSLLAHADRRVRMEAQFALAAKGTEAVVEFTRVARSVAAPTAGVFKGCTRPDLARLHAIWGLDQIGRKDASAYAPLVPLLDDKDAEVRAQATKILGGAKYAAAKQALLDKLHDASPRVKFFAAMAVAKLKATEAAPAILELLRANNDQDAYLRHACVLALVGIATEDGELPAPFDSADPVPLTEEGTTLLKAASQDKSDAVRLASVLAMRRVRFPEVASLLSDANPRIVAEAARAINDEPIVGAMPALAKQAALKPASDSTPLREAIELRALNALFRLGRADDAVALSKAATNAALEPFCRQEAIFQLGNWANPPQRDRLLGITRPLPARDAESARLALASVWSSLLGDSSSDLKLAALEAAQKLEARGLASQLSALVGDDKQPADIRAEALTILGGWDDKQAIASAVKVARLSGEPALQRASILLLPKGDPADAIATLQSTFTKDSPSGTAQALRVLSQIPGQQAEAMLSGWIEKLKQGHVSPNLQLDVIEAAKSSKSGSIQTALKTYLDSLPKDRTIAAFPFLLEGGDVQAGKKVFFENTAAQCTRCHKINGQGSEVGPVLEGIATRQPSTYLLESVLFPNNKIAPGFEMTMVMLKDGKVVSGMVRKETDTELQISAPLPDAPFETVKKSDVANRIPGVSAMPEIFTQVLSQREIRDLVAYLSSLKEGKGKGGGKNKKGKK
jgi:putative heme-binding domain-containing protein